MSILCSEINHNFFYLYSIDDVTNDNTSNSMNVFIIFVVLYVSLSSTIKSATVKVYKKLKCIPLVK